MHRWLVVAAVTGFVSACSGASRGTTPPRAENGPEVCANRPMFGPVQLDRAAAKRRYGASAKYLGDAPTSQQHAVEVCGTGGQIEWLTRVTCANGSSPFPSGAAAHQARSGSVGAVTARFISVISSRIQVGVSSIPKCSDESRVRSSGAGLRPPWTRPARFGLLPPIAQTPIIGPRRPISSAR